MRRLPTGVTRLLDDLGQSPLAGDLMEDYASGRSHLWLWREVAAAIMRSACSTIGSHKLLATGSVVAGWAFFVGIAWMTWQVMTAPWITWQVGTAPMLSSLVAQMTVSEWRELASYPQWGIASFATTWLLARAHRRYAFAIAGSFIGSFFVLLVASSALRLLRVVLLHDDQPVSWIIFRRVLTMLCMLVLMVSGGVLGARRSLRSTRTLGTDGTS